MLPLLILLVCMMGAAGLGNTRNPSNTSRPIWVHCFLRFTLNLHYNRENFTTFETHFLLGETSGGIKATQDVVLLEKCSTRDMSYIFLLQEMVVDH